MKSANSQESNPLIAVVGLGDSTSKESMAAFGVCHSQRMIYFVLWFLICKTRKDK